MEKLLNKIHYLSEVLQLLERDEDDIVTLIGEYKEGKFHGQIFDETFKADSIEELLDKETRFVLRYYRTEINEAYSEMRDADGKFHRLGGVA